MGNENTAAVAAAETPAQAFAPVVETPANTPSISAEVAAYNASVEAATGESLVEPDETDEPEEIMPEVEEVAPTDEPEETEPDKEEEKEAEKPAETKEAEAEFEFTPDSDAETFEAEKAAYLETVEIPAPLQTIFDRHAAEIEAVRAQTAELEVFGDLETVKQTMAAFAAMYETDVTDSGEIVKNAKPLVNLLRSDYANEFSPIAQEIFESDSLRYKGFSVFQERLIDTFKLSGKDLGELNQFLLNRTPLQMPVQSLPVPEGVNKDIAEAWHSTPEYKRFEIESLAEEIKTLESELPEASDYYKQELQTQIADKRARFQTELELVQSKQNDITRARQEQEATARYQQEATVRFQNEVVETYNQEIFSLADTFAQELAPRLTFLDGDAQIGAARDMEARILNALESDGQGNATPNAEYTAKQLAAEGVKFDFINGRELLARLYKATEKVKRLETNRESPQAIEIAKRQKKAILADIKAEKHELLGQISAKYVKSNGAATAKKIDAVKAKQQITRKRIIGENTPNRATNGDVGKDIAAYNRAHAKAISNGDDLYDEYQ